MVTEFQDHIFVAVDAESFFFLHDLIASYVKDTKEKMVRLKVYLNPDIPFHIQTTPVLRILAFTQYGNMHNMCNSLHSLDYHSFFVLVILPPCLCCIM